LVEENQLILLFWKDEHHGILLTVPDSPRLTLGGSVRIRISLGPKAHTKAPS